MNIQTLFELGMKRKLPNLIPPRRGLLNLNLGAGRSHVEHFQSLDWPQWDADTMPIPYDADSIHHIYAFHFLEHTREPIKVLREIERVLVGGGVATIVTPHAMSEIAVQDLDHKSFFHEDTWKHLFHNQGYDKHIGWRLQVHANFIMGINFRNLALFTQLVKV